MSKEQRAQLRRQIERLVRQGVATTAIAERFGVGKEWVRTIKVQLAKKGENDAV